MKSKLKAAILNKNLVYYFEWMGKSKIGVGLEPHARNHTVGSSSSSSSTISTHT